MCNDRIYYNGFHSLSQKLTQNLVEALGKIPMDQKTSLETKFQVRD